jgi:hypothetical protein
MLYKDGLLKVFVSRKTLMSGKFIMGAQERRSGLPAFSCIQTTAAWLNLQANYCFKLHFKRIRAPQALFRAAYEKWVQD